MQVITKLLSKIPEFAEISKSVDRSKTPIAVSGLSAIHRAHFFVGLRGKSVAVLLCADEFEGQRLQKDLANLTGEEVGLLVPRPFVFHKVDSQSHQWEEQRIALLSGLLEGKVTIIVATIEGVLQSTLSPETLRATSIPIQLGAQVDLSDLTQRLAQCGYTRADQVEGVGQFSVRGGILDVFPPNSPNPYRIDFFGDEVDSMGEFDPLTQRRTQNVKEITLLPVRESGNASFFDYLPEGSRVVFADCNRIADRAKTWLLQLEEDMKIALEEGGTPPDFSHLAITYPQFIHKIEGYPVLFFESFALSSYPMSPQGLFSLTAKQIPPFGGNLDNAVTDIKFLASEGGTTLVLLASQSRAETLLELLEQEGLRATLDYDLKKIPQKGKITIALGGLSAGFEYSSAKIAMLTEGQSLAKPTTKKKVTNREKLKSYADLSVGDLVVHEQHGIGRFMGMEQITNDGVAKDYVKIAYAGTDTLFVPATQLDQVSKYIGGGEGGSTSKSLSKLGSGRWEKAKRSAKASVADLAQGLIKLYAERQRLKGFAFSPDTTWQKEFEDSFEFSETEDQLRSTEELKRDMESEMPMERLLCGDVGYGKTEVAFRGMMKCVQESKQAAILVPTTVLARQHYLTAMKRFANYPINIDMVSRNRTQAQMKETLRKVKEGEVDILIGTHRLFQKDLEFRDLGLLIVDEEQRFGVAQKEKLKEKFSRVDVLTLSATPIPRTLNMALSGLRDMSTLEQPPANRQPVQTYVMEEDAGVLRDAMLRELERGGQVIYLHNRVDTIARTARKVAELVGEDGVVAVAHGKMDADEIHRVMTDMTDGTVNILVCTTIIETGIDLPNANALIITDADKLGLAQLHQIRGRVGRSTRRAYAYLTYREGKILSEVATKRLSALREFAQFGSGFKIAMRDLEIRGAGNVLGPEQSGFVLSVGYDLYLKLLEEAVLTAQGLPLPVKKDCLIDIAVSASIPNRYVPMDEQRMDLYRQIASIQNKEDQEDLVDELIDRFGEPPRSVLNLIEVAMIRTKACECKLSSIVQKRDLLRFHVTEFDLPLISAICGVPQYLKKLTFVAGDNPHLLLRLPPKAQLLDVARDFLEEMSMQKSLLSQETGKSFSSEEK